MTSTKTNRLKTFIPVLMLIILLAGCNSATQPSPTPESEPSPSATSTDIVPPTPVTEPATIWLIAEPVVADDLRQEFAAWLAAQASQDGYLFTEAEEFRSSDVPEQLKAVVFLSSYDDINSLTANMPDTQFVMLTPEDVQPSSNLSVIRTSPNQASFLAGYLATLNAPDFRSGALFMEGAAGSTEQQESFLNGGRYFCGRCSPAYAPIVAFPQVGVVPAGSDSTAWQAAFDLLNQNRIEMIYLPAEGLKPDFLSYLAVNNVAVISDAPPPPDFESTWIATITSSPLSALESIWPEIMAGEGGQSIVTGLEITDVNPDNLSTGRLEMAEKIILDLTAGLIAPLSVP